MFIDGKNVKPLDNLKNCYFRFHMSYGLQTCQGADIREELQHANTYTVTDFLPGFKMAFSKLSLTRYHYLHITPCLH